MKETEDCFLKVKNDYLKFLNKERIFDQSKSAKIISLKKTYIPISFWIENQYNFSACKKTYAYYSLTSYLILVHTKDNQNVYQ